MLSASSMRRWLSVRLSVIRYRSFAVALRRTFAHVFEEAVGQADVGVNACSQADAGLVLPMKVGSPSGHQVITPGEAGVFGGIRGRVLAMEYFNPLQSYVDQALQQAGQIESPLRKSHRVRQRRHAPAVCNSTDACRKCWFIALNRGLGLVGKIDIESLLQIGGVAFVAQHSGEMRAPHLVSSVGLRFVKRDIHA